MEIITKNANETKRVGEEFAASLIETKKRHLVVGLIGDLGSGKTTFVQGFARGLGIKKRMISPTFIIMRSYNIPEKSELYKLYHVDLYRLEGDVKKEIVNLGITEIWKQSGNVLLIEWAEKVRDEFPGGAYFIHFKNMGGDRRKIIVKEPIQMK